MPDNEFVLPVKLNFLRNQSLDELLLKPEGIISSDALQFAEDLWTFDDKGNSSN